MKKPLSLPASAAIAAISLSAISSCNAFTTTHSTTSPFFTTTRLQTAALSDETQTPSTTNNKQPPSPKKYVIIGGGWAGWGAAKALCEGLPYTIPPTEPTDIGNYQYANITLIDALPDPTGATPYISTTGKPVEAGTRGFWKDYPNINKLCAQLGIEEEEVFTPFTNSSFYSPDGLEATAPVFSEATVESTLGDVPLVGNVLKNAFQKSSSK